MALPAPTLRTERLVLRPFDEGDIDPLLALHSDPVVMRYWDGPPWTDRSRAEWFVGRCREMAEQGTGTRVVVALADEGEMLGWVGLNPWNPEFRSASLGHLYAERAWGRGIATEAAAALLDWGFDTLDLNRVQAQADTRNHASARVLEKLGFQLEGTLREDCIVDGVVSDSWVFGLLRRDRAQMVAR